MSAPFDNIIRAPPASSPAPGAMPCGPASFSALAVVLKAVLTLPVVQMESALLEMDPKS